MTPANITLLYTVCGSQSTTYMLYQIYSLEHYFHAPHHSLTKFTPTNRGPTFPPIKLLKGRHTKVGTIVVVVGEVNYKKAGILAPTKIQNTHPKYILESLMVHSL